MTIPDLAEPARSRGAELMEKYADLPIDLADATLVARAEQLDDHRTFTLDADFEVYRLRGNSRFEILSRTG